MTSTLISKQSHIWRALLCGAVITLPLAALEAQTNPPAQTTPATAPQAAPLSKSAPLPGAGAAAAPVTVPSQKPSADIAGVWIDHTGRGAVEIAPCGQRLCGHIYWLQSTVDTKTGRQLVDHKNPDTAKRRQPMCGVQIITNLVKTGTGRAGVIWGGGKIYNPEDGDSHDVEVQLLGPDRLQVMGYAGFKFLNETYTWTRAPASALRCGPAHS
ncbi:MAG: DUF2147 domain-containing protein [Hyphomicrobiaceae bacterium]|nr:DUF2147 domain-containing protein [Hyphomicrobiaceae bacterium]